MGDSATSRLHAEEARIVTPTGVGTSMFRGEEGAWSRQLVMSPDCRSHGIRTDCRPCPPPSPNMEIPTPAGATGCFGMEAWCLCSETGLGCEGTSRHTQPHRSPCHLTPECSSSRDSLHRFGHLVSKGGPRGWPTLLLRCQWSSRGDGCRLTFILGDEPGSMRALGSSLPPKATSWLKHSCSPIHHLE